MSNPTLSRRKARNERAVAAQNKASANPPVNDDKKVAEAAERSATVAERVKEFFGPSER